jgi:hypothetical protein
MSNPYKLADFAAGLTTASGPELQAVLEERDAVERLRLVLELVVKEREVGGSLVVKQREREEDCWLMGWVGWLFLPPPLTICPPPTRCSLSITTTHSTTLPPSPLHR